MTRFQPGRAPTIAFLSGAVVFLSLGIWQVQRHGWRQEWLAERHARIDQPPVGIARVLADPDAFRDRRAVAHGRLLREHSIAVSSLRHGRDGGVSILTPLVPLAATGAGEAPLLLVDRGVVPLAALEAFLQADAGRTEDAVAVTGLVRPLRVQPVEPGSAQRALRHWPRFDPERPDAVAALQAQLPAGLAPLWLQLEADAGTPPLRAGIVRPQSPVDHLAYAAFWFLLALAAVAHWVGYGFHRSREQERARQAQENTPG